MIKDSLRDYSRLLAQSVQTRLSAESESGVNVMNLCGTSQLGWTPAEGRRFADDARMGAKLKQRGWKRAGGSDHLRDDGDKGMCRCRRALSADGGDVSPVLHAV